jgi:hypothetical protein
MRIAAPDAFSEMAVPHRRQVVKSLGWLGRLEILMNTKFASSFLTATVPIESALGFLATHLTNRVPVVRS